MDATIARIKSELAAAARGDAWSNRAKAAKKARDEADAAAREKAELEAAAKATRADLEKQLAKLRWGTVQARP